MRPKTKKFLVLVLLAIVSAVGIGGILGSNAAWADIRQTVRNGNSYMVVNNPYASTINNMTIPGATSGISGNASSSGGMQTSSFNVSGEGGEGEGESGTFDCDEAVDKYNNGDGFGAMQWILCPGLNNTTYAATWVEQMTDGWLEIKSDIYATKDKNGNESGIYKGWSLVRNVANVAMVIFLLVIIFSQVTGYGIDNYGIKKMLPRLIMMAIIINLSFYICQIAVDLSNILGVGLRDMFGAFGENISGTGTVSPVMDKVGRVFAAVGGAGGTAAATTGAIAAGAPLWVAVVIFVLILVLVVLVAIGVMYVMLAARDILVIFCIIISPLAFVAFILPNTQDLFKKWWGMFKAALIIFPICGAVSGISRMLQDILYDSSGVAAKMILLVLPYLIFFLIPTLVKSAFAAFGKVGGALASLGSGAKAVGSAAGGRLSQAAQNSNWMQDRVQRNKWRTERKRAAHLANLGKKKYKLPTGKEVGLGEKSKFERKVADKTEEMNAPWIVQQMKDKKAQKYEDRARLAYEGVQSQNKNTMDQAMANEEAVVIERAIAQNRAESAKETLEVKLNIDRNATFTRGQLEQELKDAANEFREGDEKSYYRLQAAITSALSRGMDREILDGPLSTLQLSNADGSYGAKIANTLAGSNNQVASQFGKARFKPGATQTASIADFMGDSSDLGMAKTFANKGANYAVGMNEDILNYIKNHGGGLTTEQLVKAAAATTNEKELKIINEMLANRTSAGSNGYQVSVADLASLRTNTLDTLLKSDPNLFNDARADIIATKDTDSTRQLLDKMNQDAKNKLLGPK